MKYLSFSRISSLLFYFILTFVSHLSCSTLWREYNCHEWHHLLSRVSWWISQLSRLFLACTSTPWEWHLHQFYCSSNRTGLWFHYRGVSQGHCYWLIGSYAYQRHKVRMKMHVTVLCKQKLPSDLRIVWLKVTVCVL